MNDDDLAHLLHAHWAEQDDTITTVPFTGASLRAHVAQEDAPAARLRRAATPTLIGLAAAAAAAALWITTNPLHHTHNTLPATTPTPVSTIPPARAEAFLPGVGPRVDVWIDRDSDDMAVVCVRTPDSECSPRLTGDDLPAVIAGGTIVSTDDGTRTVAVEVSVDGGKPVKARVSASDRGPLLWAVPGLAKGEQKGFFADHDTVVMRYDSAGESIGEGGSVGGPGMARTEPPMTADDEVDLGGGLRAWISKAATVCLGARLGDDPLVARACMTTAPSNGSLWLNKGAKNEPIVLRLPDGATGATLDGRPMTVHTAPNAVFATLAGDPPASGWGKAMLEVEGYDKGVQPWRKGLLQQQPLEMVDSVPDWTVPAN